MCWLMKTSQPTETATLFLRCAPTAIDWWQRLGKGHRQWRIATRAASHLLASGHDSNDGIVNVSFDRTIMHEKQVGNPVQSSQCFLLVNADWFFRQIGAGGYDWEIELAHQQMM